MERIKIKRYSPSVPVAEAIQWTGDNLGDITQFLSGKPWNYTWCPQNGRYISFYWDEGDTAKVVVDDYIVKDTDGTLTPYKRDQFQALYEFV